VHSSVHEPLPHSIGTVPQASTPFWQWISHAFSAGHTIDASSQASSPSQVTTQANSSGQSIDGPTQASSPKHSISHTSLAQSFAQIDGHSPPTGTGSGSHSPGAVVAVPLPSAVVLAVSDTVPVAEDAVVPISAPAVPVAESVAIVVEPLADAEPVGELDALIDPAVWAIVPPDEAPSVSPVPSSGSPHPEPNAITIETKKRRMPPPSCEGQPPR
jgi:hypothetical protein